jgi:hypothetical protein
MPIALDHRQAQRHRCGGVLAGVALGALLFLIVCGVDILRPGNIAWLLDSPDPRTHYLGWCFFRESPWMLPPGANPAYGEAMGSSIVYSDSIPLMALLCKPFSSWLPREFQYTGLWLLLSLLLQGLFAALLAREVVQRFSAQFILTAFLLVPSVLLQRLQGHYALAAHWPILCALWLYLRGRPMRGGFRWACVVLAAIASLIHLYLAVLVLAIWHADLWRRWLAARCSRPLLTEYITVAATTVLAMWTAGYFILGVGDAVTPGAAGAYGMNLLAPLNPQGSSLLLPDLPLSHVGQVEGNCYLGAGMLLLSLLALMTRFRVRGEDAQAPSSPRAHWMPLAIVLLGLLLFALTPRVSAGSLQLTLPNLWGPLSEILRASGRMVWPAYYAVMLLVAATLARRLRPRTALAVLSFGLLLQVVDLSPQLLLLRRHFQEPATAPARLAGEFWNEVAQRKRHIALVPMDGEGADWYPLARFAADHGLSINYGYFARYSWDARVAAERELQSRMLCGRLRDDTLYILTDLRLMSRLDLRSISFVDGYCIVSRQR